MYSETYKQLKKEIQEKQGEREFSKKQVIILEQQIRKELPQKCDKCDRTENLTLDHIIPIDILKSFGIDTEREIVEGNYRILCKPCNFFKSNKLDFADKRTKDILIGLLNQL